MIQVLALREFFSQKQGKNIKSEVWFEKGIRAPSLEDILLRPKDFLKGKVESSENFNIYFTVAECLEEPGRKLLRQYHIPFDVDKLAIGGADDVPDSELLPIAQVVCQALGVPFNETGILFSGNGLQFFVGISEPITDVGYYDQSRPHYKALCDKITLALTKAGLSGAADPSVWSPARLMRMPGTQNIKPNKPTRVARVLQPSVVRGAFTLESASGIPVIQQGEALNARVLADLVTPDVKAILDPQTGCKFISWAHLNPEKVSEPEWYAALSVVGRFPEGRKFAHKMSEGHPGYSYDETDTKINQALEASGPRTCKSIEAISDKCKLCVHHDTNLISPIRIEGPDHIKTEKSGFYEVIYDKEGQLKRGKPAYGDLWKFFSRKHKYISIENTQILYIFNGKFWEEMGKDHVLKFAQDHFRPEPSSTFREEFYKWVKVYNLQDMDWFANSVEGFLNFQNGVYDVASDQLLPHSPDYGFRSILPCAYDPEAKSPRFDQFMKDITLGRQELIDVLQEYMGYIFGNMACRHEKILVLQGDGSNGKSTFVRLIRELCGDAHAGISVKSMSNDQNRYVLEGKLVNIAEENDKSAFRDTELLKNFASGGQILVKKLFSQPYEYENRTKLIMLCNALPTNMDQTHGFYRKLAIIPFDARFEKSTGKDKGIFKKLKDELPGIFNFAMEGYRRLTKQDDFTDSDIVTKNLEQYQNLTDTVRAWFNEDVQWTGVAEDAVSTNTLYSNYKQYCQETGVKDPDDQARFGKHLKKLMLARGCQYERAKLGKTGERHWKIKGLKILNLDS